ncbi:MAG: ribonuclease HI [bacterium]|nr:ribonuclease HI [bacterium]
MNDKIVIYTDGACSGNPGDGGWGALVRIGSDETELYGGEHSTTNNKMELTAVIKSLEFIGNTSSDVELWTDSQYVKNGITDWIKGWKKNGWRNSQKQPVKNRELWEKLDELSSNLSISWNWVKGHNGHPENERVDELARRGISELV